jgi:hypothetical protein
MKLKYAGPRPIISHHGISFKDGKDDKYVYLSYAIDILESMDSDYKNTGKYSHIVKEHTLSDLQMQDIIRKYHPTLEDDMMFETNEYEKHLKDEILKVNSYDYLSNDEKVIWIKNLELMLNYRIQRAKNKIFYHHIIQTIVEFIIEKDIKEIDVVFHERFWHVFQTIEGEIMKKNILKFPKLVIDKIDEKLIIKLIIE